jgi:tetratricopeptide (TPR) repeat protein
MNSLICKPGKLLALLGLLASLAGCQHLNDIRIEPDRPGDLGTLMDNREYGRVEQLLIQYPYLDTPETRMELNDQTSAYETAVLSDARAMESVNDLYGANELLLEALRKLPNSLRFNEYKCRLDAERAERLRENERRELLADADYFMAQQEIYAEHLSLDSPSLVQRLKNTLSQQLSNDLAMRLLVCGEEALQEDDLEMADKCLLHAQAIKDTPEVRSTLSHLESRRAALRQSDEKKTRIIQVKEEKRLARKHRDKTQEVLEKTGQALDNNDLLAARRIFSELPKDGGKSREVTAVRTRLDDAIRSRVREITSAGDRLYRADNVNRAINSWEQALELDPENPELIERLERARKVLGRLEELKNRKRAPINQSKEGT